MANCVNCGKPVGRGVKLCPSCGTAAAGKGTGKTAKKSRAPGTAPRKAGTSPRKADPADAEAGKGMAIVGYLAFFIPLLLGEHRKSAFVKFHTNQGTVLFIAGVGGMIALSILSSILGILFGALLWRTGLILGFFGAFLIPVFGIGFLVLEIIGILNAINGRMTPLPIIGKFEMVK